MTATPTSTRSYTPTPTASTTKTVSATQTQTRTPTPTISKTSTISASPTQTRTPTQTPTRTAIPKAIIIDPNSLTNNVGTLGIGENSLIFYPYWALWKSPWPYFDVILTRTDYTPNYWSVSSSNNLNMDTLDINGTPVNIRSITIVSLEAFLVNTHRMRFRIKSTRVMTAGQTMKVTFRYNSEIVSSAIITLTMK